jgi:hypothetical protein
MISTNQATINDAIPVPSLLPQRQKEHQPEPAVPKRGQTRLRKQFDSTGKRIKSPVVRETVESVFVSLSRLCDILDIVEINTSARGPLPVTLAAFSLVDDEAKSLIRLIEKKISKIQSIKGTLRRALDGTSFALRHELKRVFGQELSALSSERKDKQVCADVMRAHGLLSNCFQQSILTLARVFDPSVNSKLLFDSYRDRLEQSQVLIRDLSSFVPLARRAAERDAEASELLIRELKAFGDGPLHYLMYKDWDEFEDIAREVTSSYGSARHGFIAHCFGAYLEALINQVQMRSVFNEGAPERRGPKSREKKTERAGLTLTKRPQNRTV